MSVLNHEWGRFILALEILRNSHTNPSLYHAKEVMRFHVIKAIGLKMQTLIWHYITRVLVILFITMRCTCSNTNFLVQRVLLYIRHQGAHSLTKNRGIMHARDAIFVGEWRAAKKSISTRFRRVICARVIRCRARAGAAAAHRKAGSCFNRGWPGAYYKNTRPNYFDALLWDILYPVAPVCLPARCAMIFKWW